MTSPDTAPNEPRTLATPNNVPWRLYGMLGRLAADADDLRDRELTEQDGLVSIVLGTTAIEAFANLYFRTLADEPEFTHARDTILTDLKRSSGATVEKLPRWAKLAFRRPIEESDARWAEYAWLRKQRNSLLHFKSSHEHISLPGITITGLASTEVFATIDAATPRRVMQCVRGVVELVSLARGLTAPGVARAVHIWLGAVDTTPRSA
jgi:hypothetical protein